MKIKSVLLSIDVVVQLILLILLGGAVLVSLASMGATAIFMGYILFFLGVWQLASGLLFGIVRKDGKRAEYIIGSIVYIAGLVIGCFALEGWNMPLFLTLFLWSLFFLVIPSGIAIWYFRHSQADLEKIRLEIKNGIVINFDMDDVLDCEEILKRERI